MLLPSLIPSSLYQPPKAGLGEPRASRPCWGRQPLSQPGLAFLQPAALARQQQQGSQQQRQQQRIGSSGSGSAPPAHSRRSLLFSAGLVATTSVEVVGRRAAAEVAQAGLPAVQNLVPAVAYQPKEQQQLADVLRQAGRKALGGGIPGAAAMAIQVFTLMWLRTTVNYQYRYGTTTTQALKTLYKDGGIPRFYRGLLPALLQGPLSRFGDTAANAGVLSLLDAHESTAGLPIWAKTAAASASAGAFRIFLMPVDAVKTIMQVEGKAGFPALMAKVRANGPTVLYHGAIAASLATMAGHLPWFTTYNYLNELLPKADTLPLKLGRSAVIGFCASAVSDTCSNSIRVVKTAKQASTTAVTYPQVVRMVIEKDGLLGLFGRGLKTKILANGLQGLLFSVLWRLGQDYYAAHVSHK